MEDKKKEFLVITTYVDAKRFYIVHKLLINELAKKFKTFKIIFIDNLLLFNKKKKIKFNDLKYYPKNIKFFAPYNSEDFLNQLPNKNYVAFTNLNRYLNYFRIHYLIKKKNIRQIAFMNFGFIPDNKNFLSFKIWKFFQDFFNRKFVFVIFKLLTILDIFQRVDIRFISNLSYKKYSKKSLVGKLNKFFKTKRFDYYDDYIKVNARVYDRLKIEKNLKVSEKYITFVDTNLEHETKIEYEGRFNKEHIKEYYRRLNKYLRNLEKTFKKKIVICVHPNPNYKLSDSKKLFKDFKVVKYQTDHYVRNGYIIVAFSSSIIVDAIYYKKKIICLDSELMGKHHNFTNQIYPKAANIFLQNFDKDLIIDKKKLTKELNKRIKNYDKYINEKIMVDGNNIGVEKISRILQKKYYIT